MIENSKIILALNMFFIVGTMYGFINGYVFGKHKSVSTVVFVIIGILIITGYSTNDFIENYFNE